MTNNVVWYPICHLDNSRQHVGTKGSIAMLKSNSLASRLKANTNEKSQEYLLSSILKDAIASYLNQGL